VYTTDSRPILAEEVVKILFEAKPEKISLEQPLHCTQNHSFVVNCDKLSHPSDIRMDDVGCWCNTGVDKLYLRVSFRGDKKVSTIEKLGCKPSVTNKSVYCLTRTYWKHKQQKSFSRQLHQLTGKYIILLMCIFMSFS
jgi:hypothetical protein